MEGRQRPFIMEFRVNVIATGTGRLVNACI